MIESPSLFAAVLLLVAGLFPALAARVPVRLFEVVPPIVISYVVATALAVAGCWRASPEIVAVQEMTLTSLMPPLVFALVVRCDLRAVAALGPRVLVAFACAAASILGGVVIAWAVWRPWLPAEAWRGMASVGSGWVGGTANLVAVSDAVDASPELVSMALITDTVCYTIWVLTLFGTVPLASRFNAWMGAAAISPTAATDDDAVAASTPTASGDVLLWLALGLLAGAGAQAMAAHLPTGGVLSAKSWTLLLVTLAGILAALTPLRRLPGADAVAAALLAVVVVTMASQGSFAGMAQAPIFILAGLTALAVHALAMVLAARVFRLDLALCGIASLANVGGVGSAPLLAAAHAPALAPLGVLLALLGYVVGTAAGLTLARLLVAIGLGGA